ncbi:phosphatase PAP2 family protein [Sphingomonas sp. CL5.1]|uniref:phosphatase PAP2 family protein n=1 Tax=Sphingomonas sp. CL5.1 TaxID=2653203 RepID=UPI00158328EA|nr:phosphatase PAP2 family protein [Sphingomonas sp. CL5.1]QKR98372.1 phosphatase PAP2 family protein [Sphingomonas sp. CL5.1]
MHHPVFDMPVMEWLADHRTRALTDIFLFFSDMGEVQGYLLITTCIYVLYDKRLAVRLSLMVSLAMCANHILKIIIKNPRPFIREGDYLRKWAVPLDNARDLATEWSTPSGHAMAAASFYTVLYGCWRNRLIRILAVFAILLTGASRPYLGVHYVEDILLGWTIGLGLGLIALRNGERIAAAWSRFGYAGQVAISVGASLAFWLMTIIVNGGMIDGQPRAFLGYAGTVTGIVIAWPLEQSLVNFDPRSGSVLFKALRLAFSIGLSFLTLEGFKRGFSLVASDYSIIGYLLQYLRYILVALASLFMAPWIFTRFDLARRLERSSLG